MAFQPWDVRGMASPHRQPAVSITPIEQQDELAQSYNAALQAFESARRVVADLSSGLHDPHAAQMDVSARISSRQGRCTLTGRKRKMSPCLYDFGDHAPSSCPGAGAKADTPTQELLPACRSELRNHQLQAVRWLSSLETQGVTGILADELQADRRAAIAGLLAHVASTPPDDNSLLLPRHSGGSSAPGPAPSVCLLLAPADSLTAWADCIQEAVEMQVLLNDGSQASAAAIGTACSGGGGASSGSAAASGSGFSTGAPMPLQPQAQQAQYGAAFAPVMRRMASGGACPSSTSAPTAPSSSTFPAGASGHPIHTSTYRPRDGSAGSSSAAGVHPSAHAPHPLLHLSQHHYPGLPQRPPAPPPQPMHPLVVILSPLEQLQRDLPLLAHIPTPRLLVADLACQLGSKRLEQGAGEDPMDGRGSNSSFGRTGPGLPPQYHAAAAAGGGTWGQGGRAPEPGRAYGSAAEGQGPSGGGGGEDIPLHTHLHLLTRLPAESRVLLSAGEVDPPGDSVWLLLQLLVPAVHRPLWDAVRALQQAVLASGARVSPQSKERIMMEMHSRLVALLRPLALHRAARDVDLSNMRSASTSLNLYDHFSSVQSNGGR